MTTNGDRSRDGNHPGVSDNPNAFLTLPITILTLLAILETTLQGEKLLDSLNLPDFREDFQITCDLKLINIVAGIQSCSSLHSCPYCEGCKVSGKWKAGSLRTFGSIREHQKKWKEETNGNRKLLKNYI